MPGEGRRLRRARAHRRRAVPRSASAMAGCGSNWLRSGPPTFALECRRRSFGWQPGEFTDYAASERGSRVSRHSRTRASAASRHGGHLNVNPPSSSLAGTTRRLFRISSVSVRKYAAPLSSIQWRAGRAIRAPEASQDTHEVGIRQRIRSGHSRLVPLIAHDRAGFGGALVSFGVAMCACARYARGSTALWQALAIAGAAGFSTAIGVHPAIGYLSGTHLGPAVLGGAVFVAGLVLASREQA